MANHIEIIRATRAAARLVNDIASFKRVIADAERENAAAGRMLRAGTMRPDDAAHIRTLAQGNWIRATARLHRAELKLEAVQATLARNPL
jgi:hypothetical protein